MTEMYVELSESYDPLVLFKAANRAIGLKVLSEVRELIENKTITSTEEVDDALYERSEIISQKISEFDLDEIYNELRELEKNLKLKIPLLDK